MRTRVVVGILATASIVLLARLELRSPRPRPALAAQPVLEPVTPRPMNTIQPSPPPFEPPPVASATASISAAPDPAKPKAAWRRPMRDRKEVPVPVAAPSTSASQDNGAPILDLE
jgi:hypothetical protein